MRVSWPAAVACAPDLRKQMQALTPMGRLGKPEEIATAVFHLASPPSNWVTGKIFEIDGGSIASNWPVKMPTGLLPTHAAASPWLCCRRLAARTNRFQLQDMSAVASAMTAPLTS